MPPHILRRSKSSNQDADGRRAIGITLGTIAAVLILLILCCKLRRRDRDGGQHRSRYRKRQEQRQAGGRNGALVGGSDEITSQNASLADSDIPERRRQLWLDARRRANLMELGRRRPAFGGLEREGVDRRIGRLEGFNRRRFRAGPLFPRRRMRPGEGSEVERPAPRPNFGPLRRRYPGNLPPIARAAQGGDDSDDDDDGDDDGSENIQPGGGPGVLCEGPPAGWPQQNRMLAHRDSRFNPRAPSLSESTVDPPPPAYIPRQPPQRQHLYRTNLAHDHIRPPTSVINSETEDDVVHFIQHRQESTPPPPVCHGGTMADFSRRGQPPSPSSGVNWWAEAIQQLVAGRSAEGPRAPVPNPESLLGMIEGWGQAEEVEIVDAVPEGGDNVPQTPSAGIAAVSVGIEVVAATPPPERNLENVHAPASGENVPPESAREHVAPPERADREGRNLQPYYESISESTGMG